jgi:tellurite resistance protein
MVDMSSAEPDRLENFPITFFAVIMGLLGLALAMAAAERAAGSNVFLSQFILGAAVIVFIVLGFFYGLKLKRHPGAVRAEWNHPVRVAFFPTISISLLLLGTALAPLYPGPAYAIWGLGAAAQAVLALSVIANWIGHRSFQAIHLSPAWFIPAVGNVIVPLAGVGFGALELSWLFFSAGLMFWVVLLTLVMNRLIFHDPLPGRLMPTLVILIAPPAVAFIAWVRLTGDVDAFGRILLNSGYVFGLVVLTQAPRFFRLPFALSWWALTFPVAALSVASFVFAHEAGSQTHRIIGFTLTTLLALAVATLIVRTAQAIRAKQICRPE